MAKRRTVVRYEGAPIGNWMVTFSDMNTLLLTFFVLLFSMSSLSVDQFRKAFSTYSSDGLGLMSESGAQRMTGVVFDPIPEVAKNTAVSELSKLKHRPLQETVGGTAEGLQEPFIDIDAPDGSVSIVFAEDILFASGSARLSPTAESYLARTKNYLEAVLAVSNRRVTIEGYDDGSSPGEEPHVFSTQRALTVLNYLLRDGVLPPQRFSMIGYGDSKPAARWARGSEKYKNCVRIVVGPEEETIFSIGEQ